MAQAVIMPRQGISVESCIIVEWHKKEGDPVKAGDLLFVYETDKAVFEEESSVEGTMLKLLYEEGDDVVCLENVCIIGEEGEDISGFLQADASEKQQSTQKETTEDKPVEEPKAAVTPQVMESGRVKISPRAKALAQKSDADLSKAQASGPEGRIIERDVVALIKQGAKVTSSAPEVASGTGVAQVDVDVNAYEEVKMSNMRKIIAKSMHESLSSMAQLTLNASFDATDIMQFRKIVKSKGDQQGVGNITINDMILYAVSRTLINHKDINAHYMGDTIRHFASTNIGIAVDAPRGLLVPTLFGANAMSLNELSAAAKGIIDQARTGQISPDLLTGGTFTVTNLGTLGVESFTPVINPPQTAILGVCTITTKLKSDGSPYRAMGLSLTFDHRAVDGAPAARYLKELCDYLENFSMSLAMESAKGSGI